MSCKGVVVRRIGQASEGTHVSGGRASTSQQVLHRGRGRRRLVAMILLAKVALLEANRGTGKGLAGGVPTTIR